MSLPPAAPKLFSDVHGAPAPYVTSSPPLAPMGGSPPTLPVMQYGGQGFEGQVQPYPPSTTAYQQAQPPMTNFQQPYETRVPSAGQPPLIYTQGEEVQMPPGMVDAQSSEGYVPRLIVTESGMLQGEYVESTSSLMKRTAALSLLTLIPIALYILVFTEIGFGATVFKNLVHNSTYPQIFSALGVAIILVLYIFDFSYWEGYHVLKGLCLCIVAGAASVAVVMSFKTRPYAPLLLYFCVVCGFFAFIYWMLYKSVALVSFLRSMGMATIFGGAVAMATGLAWAGSNNFWWGDESQLEFRNRLRVCQDMTPGNGYCYSYGQRFGVACAAGCPEIVSESACDPENPQCLAALLLWGGLFLMAFFTLVCGMAITLVSNSVQATVRGDPTSGIKVFTSPLVRIFVLFLLVLIMIMYVASSIAGASMQLTNVVVAFSMLGIILLCAAFVGSIGWGNVKGSVSALPIVQKFFKLRQSDWIKAMFIVVFSPILPFVLIISMINQLTRKCLDITKTLTSEDQHLVVTLFFHNALENMKQWRWSSVLRKATLLGFVYFVIVVGIGKITQLFLAWLNIVLSESGLSIWSISAIVFGVGIILFLIPAVPGVPIYLCCGVTLVAAGEPHFGGFAVAVAWATVVGFVCKLAGCTVQQKIIGEGMGRSVYVRSACYVNSDPIKAFRLVCSDKGWMSFQLCVLLVGGPDWPVSVMAGILRQPILKMLLGTTPILIPIATTVVAGGCLLKANEGSYWGTLAGAFSTASAMMFSAASIGFAVVLERVTTNRKADLDAIPDDPKVAKLDRIQEKKQQIMDEVTDWRVVPFLFKLILVMSVVFMWCATMVFALSGDEAFEEVNLTTDYRLPPLNGEMSNLIKRPLGLLGCGLEAVALVLFFAFGFYASTQASTRLKMVDLDTLPPPVREGDTAIARVQSNPNTIVVQDSRAAVPDYGGPAGGPPAYSTYQQQQSNLPQLQTYRQSQQLPYAESQQLPYQGALQQQTYGPPPPLVPPQLAGTSFLPPAGEPGVQLMGKGQYPPAESQHSTMTVPRRMDPPQPFNPYEWPYPKQFPDPPPPVPPYGQAPPPLPPPQMMQPIIPPPFQPPPPPQPQEEQVCTYGRPTAEPQPLTEYTYERKVYDQPQRQMTEYTYERKVYDGLNQPPQQPGQPVLDAKGWPVDAAGWT
uniref:Uncharacterized protein n=1 Tax=Hemiselmis andersenii TaxID=464988 RepID=A0A6T8PNN1_HEMAN|mmetsp:Transcript_34157/g.80094  ORF Transcript_34157/g.80094 Transcript_34157/m.80094 type:complete len:1166 (+) Transcript_34157:226-3723(+)